MKDLYILGAGGHAREVYYLAGRIGLWNVKGLLDIEEPVFQKFHNREIPVFSESILENVLKEETCLAAGVAGSTKLLRNVVDKYKNEFDFPNLIDPSVIMDHDSIIMGQGNIITQRCILTTFIHMGSFNVLNVGTIIHHDVKIESYNIFGPSVNISGGVEVVSDNFFGVKSTVLQYLKIGSANIIGAASLVTKNIESEMTVVGVPAKSK